MYDDNSNGMNNPTDPTTNGQGVVPPMPIQDQADTFNTDNSSTTGQSDETSFDWDKVFSSTYGDAQNFATELEQKGDKESLELASAIRELGEDFFTLTPSEEKFKQFANYLIERNFEKDVVVNLVAQVVDVSTVRAFSTVINTMNEEQKAYWDDLVAQGANFYQQMTLLNVTSERLLNKDFDTLYSEELDLLIDSTIALFDKKIKEDLILSRLSDEQIAEVQELMDTGHQEVAISLIYKMSKENGIR